MIFWGIYVKIIQKGEKKRRVCKKGVILIQNGVSEEILDQNGEFLEGYLKGVEDSQRKREEKKDVLSRITEQSEFQLFVKDNYGSFYFNFYNRLLDKIEPQYLTRFLYLCTYLDYEGRLVQKKGCKNVCIKENELHFVLKLTSRETLNTKKELISKGFISVKDNIIYINDKYCKRGDILKNKKIEKIRVFNYGIKDIYEASSKTEHKKLAILFQLLPFINLRWNVVCKNPDEELLENIQPYTIKELMILLKQTNITRFKRQLLELTVVKEAVIMINTNKYGDLLTVNPRVYYKGVNIDELSYLIRLFKVNKDQ